MHRLNAGLPRKLMLGRLSFDAYPLSHLYKKDTCLGHVKPPPAASCRVFKVLRRSEFCSFCPHGIFIMDKSRQNEAKRCKSRPPTVVEK